MKTPKIESGAPKSRFWSGLQKVGKSLGNMAQKAVHATVNISDAYNTLNDKTGGVLSLGVKALSSALLTPEFTMAATKVLQTADKYSHIAEDIIGSDHKSAAALEAFKEEAAELKTLAESSVKYGERRLPKATVATIQKKSAALEAKRKKLASDNPELAAAFKKMGGSATEVATNLSRL